MLRTEVGVTCDGVVTMGQLIMLMAITYFVAEIVILCHLKCPPEVTPRGNV
jgi:hypothetical protein